MRHGHIHQHEFQPHGEVIDAEALAQFQKQWATYGKLVASNGLAHREVTALLCEELSATFPTSFCFLDIACGDARIMPEALAGLPVRHYHGIDLSQAALDLAAANLESLDCEVDLDHRDFFESLQARDEKVDAAWCGLSIHHLHTDAKRDMLCAVRDALSPEGVFLLFEPTCANGEDRDAYLARFERVNRSLWAMLDDGEWGQIWNHVSVNDFPETADDWLALGADAGFKSGRQVFADPTDMYRMYRFDA